MRANPPISALVGGGMATITMGDTMGGTTMEGTTMEGTTMEAGEHE